jgi:hypothetical protein
MKHSGPFRLLYLKNDYPEYFDLKMPSSYILPIDPLEKKMLIELLPDKNCLYEKLYIMV